MAKVFRPPPFDLAAVLSQPHPTVDLKSKELEERTRTFLKNLTNFKEKAINAITERRKHQSTEKKKILEKTRAVEAETNQCKLKEIELVAREYQSVVLGPMLTYFSFSLYRAGTRKGRAKRCRIVRRCFQATVEHASRQDRVSGCRHRAIPCSHPEPAAGYV